MPHSLSAPPRAAPEDVSDLVGRRGAVALIPVHGDAGPPVVTVTASDATPLVVEPESPAGEALAAWVARADRVVLLDDGKPAWKALAAMGLEVARPICGRTLDRLLGGAAGGSWRPAPDVTAASERARRELDELGPRLDGIARAGLKGVARLECLVIPSFAALERRGLFIDVAGWRSLVSEAAERATAARRDVVAALGDAVDRDLFGEPVLALENDAEVKAVIERVLGRKLDDITKQTLAALEHPVGEALLRFREGQKIVSTYGEAFLGYVDSKTSRIHATFEPLGAATGRVSSCEPNLQNLPSSSEFHRCVCAPEGRRLVTADYATCELRILADLSGDEQFIETFERGEDLHASVAARMFGVPVSKTENPELRARAKAINFGLMYGMGATGLSRRVGSTVDEAERLLEQYFAAFPSIRSYLDRSVDEALERGYAETVLGRRLRFDPDTLALPNARGELERVARNMPIQGCSADMTKLAMVRVHERMQQFNDAGLVNTVHDELVVECSQDEASPVAEAVVEEMEAAHRTLLRRVPPLVEVHVGLYWSH